MGLWGSITGCCLRPLSLILFIFLSSVAQGQQAQLDTEELRAVITEWNFAHNNKSIETFRRLYASRLLFYTEELSSGEAIAIKEKLFRKHEEFQQDIREGISFTPYASGVTKCDFIKVVKTRRNSEEYPSYLLISYQDSDFKIVGESDSLTDARLHYKLDLGEELEFGNEQSTTSAASTSVNEHIRLDTLLPDPTTTTKLATKLPWLAVGGNYIITIPKTYFWTLTGVIVIGFVVLATTRRRAQRSEASVKKQGRKNSDSRVAFDDFTSFVTAFFDPLHFKLDELKQPGERGTDYPHLGAEFNYRDIYSRVLIELMYTELNDDVIHILTQRQWTGLKKYQASTALPIYVIAGTGGKAGSPDKLYLIPFAAMKHPMMSVSELERYRKHGMFFFNGKTRQLQ